MRGTRNRCRPVVACALLLLASAWGCGPADTEPPAALNPAPPIRNAFIVQIISFDGAIAAYRSENGHVPEGTGFQVLRDAGLTNVPSEDPWGGKLRYSGSGQDYEFASAGPDKAWGTKDDVRIKNGRSAN
jgi:hypothetical protein